MRTQLLVIAKAPVPGLVKTRPCPSYIHHQAADIASATLTDTVGPAAEADVDRRTIVLYGQYEAPTGWHLMPQRGYRLPQRLANGFADAARPGTAPVLIGMDTPQITARLLGTVAPGLADADADLGPATDGGWWTLALRDPPHAESLRTVSMSTSDTSAATLAALRSRGLRVRLTAASRDVETAGRVGGCRGVPRWAFDASVRRHIPMAVTA